MSEPEPQDVTVVQVETDRVDGVIRLEELVGRIQAGAAARASQVAQAPGAAGTAGDQEALTRISELAAQLADELARLEPLDE